LGSRASDTFVRVYDKGAEKGDETYAGAIRFEVQSKNRLSAANFAYYAGRSNTALGAVAIVQRELENKGVALSNDILLQSPEAPANPGKAASELERTLKWLADGVAPSVARLEAAGVSYELLHRLLFGRKHELDITSQEVKGYSGTEPGAI
jgi:DNA relaxase NicK